MYQINQFFYQFNYLIPNQLFYYEKIEQYFLKNKYIVPHLIRIKLILFKKLSGLLVVCDREKY